ncbi:Protoglobin-domain-containing protein [Obelidium mucronatum]|nr:Protoglobin-domain-containing protein [Obelidium mucronatum]
MTPSPTIRQVDRERLYTDLQYRFEYVSEFIGFDETDIAAVKGAAPLITPLVPVIIDAVYDHLFSFDITKEIFLQRNYGFHGSLPKSLDGLTPESDQIKFRKDFLGKYLVKLVTAEYDAKFVAYLDRVGRIHTSTPDKKSRVNVEYVHINGLFGWLHGFIAETVDSLPELQGADMAAKRAKVLGAFSKLLWIQNDFFAMYYLRDEQRFVGPNGSKKPVSKKGLDLNWTTIVIAAVVAVAASASVVLGSKLSAFA